MPSQRARGAHEVIRTHDANVLDRFTDVLPLCARRDEDYLREVAKNIQLVEPPVSMSLDVMSSGGFRAKEARCLVVTPTDRRLMRFQVAHFAIPSGANLNVGWYLVGGERGGGLPIANMFGGPNDGEIDEVVSLVRTVHEYAVMPAMQAIVDSGRPSPGGFFGA